MKIAICGKMCSGKSSLANYIMRVFPDYQKYSFGQKVKDLCVELFNMEGKDRQLLINFANKMRELDSDVWIRQVLKETKGKDHCIIDDVRYQNEVDALLDDGWTFIQLYIPSGLQLERIMKVYPNDYQSHIDASTHVSEQNNFIFPKDRAPLTLMIERNNEHKIYHSVNMLLMKQ